MYYSHSQKANRRPIIEINDMGIVSREQKNMLISILQLNNELSFLPDDLIGAKKEEMHQRYVDNYIIKNMNKENINK